jgi:hypothetical protein
MTTRVLAIVESIANKDYAKAESYINGELSVKALSALREHKKEFGARIVSEAIDNVVGKQSSWKTATGTVDADKAKSPDKNQIVNGHSWIEDKGLENWTGSVVATGAMNGSRAPFTKQFTSYSAFKHWAAGSESSPYDIKFASQGK